MGGHGGQQMGWGKMLGDMGYVKNQDGPWVWGAFGSGGYRGHEGGICHHQEAQLWPLVPSPYTTPGPMGAY